MEIHQKKAGPEHHRLKTMVKRCIENLRNKNFGIRNGNYERNAVVRNQGTKHREQRTLRKLHLSPLEHCPLVFHCQQSPHDINKRAESTQPNPSPRSSTRQNERNASRTRSPRGKNSSGRMFRLPCKDYLKGTCSNSCFEKWHPPECLFYKSEKWMQIWETVLLCASPG